MTYPHSSKATYSTGTATTSENPLSSPTKLLEPHTAFGVSMGDQEMQNPEDPAAGADDASVIEVSTSETIDHVDSLISDVRSSTCLKDGQSIETSKKRDCFCSWHLRPRIDYNRVDDDLRASMATNSLQESPKLLPESPEIVTFDFAAQDFGPSTRILDDSPRPAPDAITCMDNTKSLQDSPDLITFDLDTQDSKPTTLVLDGSPQSTPHTLTSLPDTVWEVMRQFQIQFRLHTEDLKSQICDLKAEVAYLRHAGESVNAANEHTENELNLIDL